MSPERHVSEFESQPRLLQFTDDEIEKIDKYHGLRLSRKDLPSVLFSAKTKNGIWIGSSDWHTFIKAQGARAAVEQEDESLEVLALTTSFMLSLFSVMYY
ncbi:hypothetical protein AJ78_08643 [Emergomyces pasteurianus Ep9510]|uniref:Uncharacterized protein n=1 Tax=Emergomyces pasteurianus Ep9510 TaxID=1447872 RepID=A0A1J9P289_9EURO|nr:hypothetical protein AJ78_08643 [Emergomyces pasteurianus Ep9510]